MTSPRHSFPGGIETGSDGGRPSRAPAPGSQVREGDVQCWGGGRLFSRSRGLLPPAGSSVRASVAVVAAAASSGCALLGSRRGETGSQTPRHCWRPAQALACSPERPDACPACAPARPMLLARERPLWEVAGVSGDRPGKGRGQGGRRGSRGTEQAHWHWTGLRGRCGAGVARLRFSSGAERPWPAEDTHGGWAAKPLPEGAWPGCPGAQIPFVCTFAHCTSACSRPTQLLHHGARGQRIRAGHTRPRHASTACPVQAVHPSLGGCVSRARTVTQGERRIPCGEASAVGHLWAQTPRHPACPPLPSVLPCKGARLPLHLLHCRLALQRPEAGDVCQPLGVPGRPSCLTEGVV